MRSYTSGKVVNNMKAKTYKYVIELKREFWPRKIANALMNTRDFDRILVSVQDMQNDTHIYGDTYRIHWDGLCVRRRKAFDVTSGANVCEACLSELKQRR